MGGERGCYCASVLSVTHNSLTESCCLLTPSIGVLHTGRFLLCFPLGINWNVGSRGAGDAAEIIVQWTFMKGQDFHTYPLLFHNWIIANTPHCTYENFYEILFSLERNFKSKFFFQEAKWKSVGENAGQMQFLSWGIYEVPTWTHLAQKLDIIRIVFLTIQSS